MHFKDINRGHFLKDLDALGASGEPGLREQAGDETLPAWPRPFLATTQGDGKEIMALLTSES